MFCESLPDRSVSVSVAIILSDVHCSAAGELTLDLVHYIASVHRPLSESPNALHVKQFSLVHFF